MRLLQAIRFGIQRRRADLRDIRREWRLRDRLQLLANRKSISLVGDFEDSAESRVLKSSFEYALSHPCPPTLQLIEGMSGQRYRTFINRYVRTISAPRYLEVGSWAGSTATAALYNNCVTAVCIDNWSLFGGPKAAFQANIAKVQSPAVSFKFIENDFRQVDFSSLGKFNIYLFDGPHEERDQYDGIVAALPALDNPCLLIVDDWNWRGVRLGTFQAIIDSDIRLGSSIEVRTTLNDQHGGAWGQYSEWHNGYFLCVAS